MQLAITACFALSAYGTFIGDLQLGQIGNSVSGYLGTAICVSPPICVFMTRYVRTLYESYVEM